jgi:hypothetical protein
LLILAILLTLAACNPVAIPILADPTNIVAVQPGKTETITPARRLAGEVFNHSYNPPLSYKTTQRYIAYVDRLAQAGYSVYKVDYLIHIRLACGVIRWAVF